MGKLFDLKNKEEGSFNIYNRSETKAEVVIYSGIGDSFWDEDMVGAKTFDKKMKELPKSVNQIDVRLNSPGGSVFDGMVIYNRLKQHKANVTVYVDGVAASIASVIMLAGDEIVFSEGAMMMIHKPMTGVFGNAKQFEEAIELLDEIEDQIVNIYRRKTKIDRSEVKAMMAEETWLNAQEALDYGFIDRTMESDETLDVAACLKGAHWINKAPTFKDNRELINKKLDKFNEKIEKVLAR